MHGQLNSPETISLQLLCECIKRLADPSSEVSTSSFQSPASIQLGLNGDRFISTRSLCVGKELPILFKCQVSAKVPRSYKCKQLLRLDESVLSILLQKEDLLLLHDLRSAVDAETEGFRSQIQSSTVPESKTPADGLVSRHRRSRREVVEIMWRYSSSPDSVEDKLNHI
jgi:hypothetical protein